MGTPTNMLPVEAARQIAIQRLVGRPANHPQVEIDADGEAHLVKSGIWIAAWVLVTHKDINDALECVA